MILKRKRRVTLVGQPQDKKGVCIRCKELSLEKECDGKIGCSKCRQSDAVCSYQRSLRKLELYPVIRKGEAYKRKKRIEYVNDKNLSRFSNARTNRVSFENVLQKHCIRSAIVNASMESEFLSEEVPSISKHPNVMKGRLDEFMQTVNSADGDDDIEFNLPDSIETEEDLQLVTERFRLPSSNLLDAIHQYVSEKFQEYDLECYESGSGTDSQYKLGPEVLLAMGMLVQELVKDQLPEFHNQVLTNDQVNQFAPNLADFFGEESVVRSDFKTNYHPFKYPRIRP